MTAKKKDAKVPSRRPAALQVVEGKMACHRCHTPTLDEDLAVTLLPTEPEGDSDFVGTTLCPRCTESLRSWLWDYNEDARELDS
jgi:hypothetical protein